MDGGGGGGGGGGQIVTMVILTCIMRMWYRSGRGITKTHRPSTRIATIPRGMCHP